MYGRRKRYKRDNSDFTATQWTWEGPFEYRGYPGTGHHDYDPWHSRPDAGIQPDWTLKSQSATLDKHGTVHRTRLYEDQNGLEWRVRDYASAGPGSSVGSTGSSQTSGDAGGSSSTAPEPPGTLRPQVTWGLYTPDPLARAKAVAQLRDASARAQAIDSRSSLQTAYRDAKTGVPALLNDVGDAYISPAFDILADGINRHLSPGAVSAELRAAGIPDSERSVMMKLFQSAAAKAGGAAVKWLGGKAKSWFVDGAQSLAEPYVDFADWAILPPEEYAANHASRVAREPWWDFQGQVLRQQARAAEARARAQAQYGVTADPAYRVTLQPAHYGAARTHRATPYPSPYPTSRYTPGPYLEAPVSYAPSPKATYYSRSYRLHRPYPVGRRGYRRSAYVFSR